MILIELWDEAPAENIVAPLLLRPEAVIYVGFDPAPMRTRLEIYEQVARAHGISTVFSCCAVPRQLPQIVEALSALVRKASCLLDLRGGDELLLAAAGIVYERYASAGLRLIQADVRSCAVSDCMQRQALPCQPLPAISAAEYIRFFGGSLIAREASSEDFPPELSAAVEALWALCRADCGAYNTGVSDLNRICAESRGAALPEICVPLSCMDRDETLPFLLRLAAVGAITPPQLDGDLRFRFTSPSFRKCLRKSGNTLELYTLLTCLRAQRDGQPLFTSGVSGATIDWSAAPTKQEAKADTINEIDAILMRGLTPVFVSCKNGSVGIDELYKLGTVADRFGGAYCLRLLVVTDYGAGGGAEPLRQRALDMGITLLDGVQNLSAEEFRQAIEAAVANHEHR